MSIEVSDELVARVASLARISLEPGEAAEMQEHFRKVLRFVEELEELELTEVEPFTAVPGAAAAQRPDEVVPSLPVAEGLQNAPARQAGGFLVPRIVDAGGSA